LGACQVGGTVIDWVMKAEAVSFRHAVELLQNDYLPLAASSSASMPAKHSTVRKLPSALDHQAEDAKLLVQVVEYYHQCLLQSPEALGYLEKRGIGSKEAIETFKLGFANRTLGYRLPASNRVEGAVIRGALQRIGLYRASGHEHLSGSIVIPVIAENGEITEVYGRKVNDNLREGTPLHLYLPGPHRGVWNAAALGTMPEVILCEALIDALTFWCAGYRNVTASYGVEGFTADHLATFKQARIQRVLIAYDRDEAGDRAAEKLSKQLLAEGLDCYRILFPKGMDANEYALKVGPAAKSLGVAIRAAQWLGKGQAPALTTSGPAVLVSVVREVADGAPLLVAEDAAKDEIVPPGLAPATQVPAVPPEVPCAALPAQVIPEGPRSVPPASVKALGTEQEYTVTYADRRYRVRGLEKNTSFECLKVNLLVARAVSETHADGEAVHVDTLDLYQARQRATFVTAAAAELGLVDEVIKADLAKLLLALEGEQERRISAARAPQASPAVPLSEGERAAALALLQDRELIERIAADFKLCGIVGERTNALVSYLCGISRKLERPLALLIQSSSAAGKSSLLDAVLRFVPEEDRVVYSAMTGQSLYYMGEMSLKHKLLAIAEEEGAHRASYALKLLQSEGELTIASTSKDPASGKLVTETYHVEGPVMIALTTTAAEIDEELLNRCLVLSVDEGREQTQAIHAAQRERRTLAGLKGRLQREQLMKLHQNVQRLIEPLAVVNPYAHRLTFLDDRTRTRRDHEKYLTLIDAIALLHQHQRVLRTAQYGDRQVKYVEVTLDDIALANRLAHQVLGHTLDELPPQTRRLLGLICEMVEQHCRTQCVPRATHRFSRREVRAHTRWGDTQLKIHLARLTELEYLLVHRGGRGQSFEYELLFDGVADNVAPHVSGLIEVEALKHAYDVERSGSNAVQSGVGRAAVGGESAAGHPLTDVEKPMEDSVTAPSARANGQKAPTRSRAPAASYVAAS
jgi:hypothetical protein